MHRPREIGRHNKRTHVFFKMQTECSARDLELNQEKYCAKQKLGIATKVNNPLHTQRIGHIPGVNMRA